MPSPWAAGRAAAMMAATAAIAACDDNNPSQPPGEVTYADVQATLTADCGGCHGTGSGRIFTTTFDSAQLQQSGLVDPTNPGQSLVILKPTGVAPHGGGVILPFSAADQDLVNSWIALLPPTTSHILTAIEVGGATGLTPPVIDGLADPVWNQAPSTSYPIAGGWADAEAVTMRAAYDASYVYLQLTWSDDAASDRRMPWVKQADGSWLVVPAKTPLPAPGTSWEQYKGGGWEQFQPVLLEEDRTHFNYEDKLAIMWNTYGPSTVAGFETSGCSVTCHDPSPAHHGNPGTTYNYVDENQAAKKYTNTQSEIADLWHWKMVRMNQHAKMDDQYVAYWVPGSGGEEDAGRHGDAGTPGYATNPATNGHPTYRGPSLDVPPYYIFDNQKVALTDDEAAALPSGTEIANMLTSGPTGGRADIDAVGAYDAANKSWSLEIRRQLVTADVTDVEFDDLSREYAFGVAIFDNAQIEHSYLPTVGKLVFQP
jgi:Ethylbenzene dehydrogenase